jgi:hypothetical protein
VAKQVVAQMKHPSSRELFRHWNARRGERPAPARSDIDPGAIRHALGDTFMLAADFVGEHRFRLAGTRVCALFTRELKGEVFAALWNEASRGAIKHLLAVIDEESIGAAAGATGYAEDGSSVGLEIVLLPLLHDGHARIRAVGVMAPRELPYWFGAKGVAELELGTVRHLNGAADQGAQLFAPVPRGGEMRRGFMVYQGGRATPKSEKTG